MDIVFHEKLYRDGISAHKMKSIQKKVKTRSPKLNLFLITLPIGKQGILEVYWYPELLQKIYRELPGTLTVVGVSDSREGAFSMIEQIIEDVGFSSGSVPIQEYFKENR